MRCAPQNPPVSVLTKGFCNGVGVPGVPHNPPISDRIKGFCDSGLSDAKTPAARIPLSPAGNVKKRMACRAGSKDHSGRTLPVGGKGGTVARSAGCCHKIETPASECLRRITRQSASYFLLAKFAKCGIVTMSTGSLSNLQRPGW